MDSVIAHTERTYLYCFILFYLSRLAPFLPLFTLDIFSLLNISKMTDPTLTLTLSLALNWQVWTSFPLVWFPCACTPFQCHVVRVAGCELVNFVFLSLLCLPLVLAQALQCNLKYTHLLCRHSTPRQNCSF